VSQPTNNKTLLVLSQVYPPDPASVGQHMSDAAREMARRGWHVIAVTANRGYDDPSIKYPAREVRDGVHVRRVAFSSFGKEKLILRALAMVGFMFHCLWAGLTTPRLGGILVSTSPPMCGFAAAVVNLVRGVPFTYWVMDLNPDQLIALGKTTEKSLTARVLNALQRFVLGRARHVIALDRFMVERLNRKRDVSKKMTVIAPWPHEDSLETVPHESNPFRAEQGVGDRFVFMYSGNHGFSTPVGAILDAAELLNGDPRALFMFIGGGVRKKEVDERIKTRNPGNIRSLPYQPLEKLKFSLSSADVHMVTMESDVVGIVHPCKIYGAMAVGRPILLLGPRECHAADILNQERIGWHVVTTDPQEIVAAVRAALATPPDELREMGRRAKRIIDQKISKSVLCAQFCDIVEGKLPAAHT